MKITCGYRSRTMGNSMEGCKSFKLKVKRLVNTRSSSLKKEGSNANVLISETCKEESKGLMKPLKIFYHKEEVEDVDNEISLFPFENIGI